MSIDIKHLAQDIQNNSLIFGCGSALFGLSKYIFDLDRKELEKQKDKAYKKSVESFKSGNISPIDIEKLQEIERQRKNLIPRFYYIRLSEFVTSEVTNTEEKYIQGARFWFFQGINWIMIPKEIMDGLLMQSEEWSEDQRKAKNKQRKMIAHEMAHELFRKIDPDNSLKLNNEENAEIFAGELLALRTLYEEGSPKRK